MHIRFPLPEEAKEIQDVLNDSKNAEYLGGISFLAAVEDDIKKKRMLISTDDLGVTGVSMIHPVGKHGIKMGSVAVAPRAKRQRVCTSLYTGWAVIAGLQGRLWLTDQVISNNPIMPTLLPTLGFSPDVVLRGKVKRHHNLTYFVKYIYQTGLSDFYERVPGDFTFAIDDEIEYIQLFGNNYTRLVHKDRNTDAHFVRVLREEALELLPVLASTDMQMRTWMNRKPQIPDNLDGLLDS